MFSPRTTRCAAARRAERGLQRFAHQGGGRFAQLAQLCHTCADNPRVFVAEAAVGVSGSLSITTVAVGEPLAFPLGPPAAPTEAAVIPLGLCWQATASVRPARRATGVDKDSSTLCE